MSRAQGKANKRKSIDELKAWHERRITHCKSCGADVVWFTTKNGGRMPVEATSVVASDTSLNMRFHRKHSCGTDANKT